MPNERKELRCFCRHHPLLGMYGLDKRGRIFVHVKGYKGGFTHTELIVFGSVMIRCRDCLRWHTVIIDANKAKLVSLRGSPDELEVG